MSDLDARAALRALERHGWVGLDLTRLDETTFLGLNAAVLTEPTETA